MIQKLFFVGFSALLASCGGKFETTDVVTEESGFSEGHCGKIMLNWTIPTKKEDGNYLSASDIAGYNIYQNTSSTSAEKAGTPVFVPGGTTITYEFKHLAVSQTYFYRIQTVAQIPEDNSKLSNEAWGTARCY